MLNSLKFMTHTRVRRKIASINKAEDKKYTFGVPMGPLGMLKVNAVAQFTSTNIQFIQ